MKYKLLIIDDNSVDVKVLSELLKDEYDVYCENDGESGFIAAEEVLPDIILLDILMPKSDGYETLGKLKNCEATKDIPVIIITGVSSTEASLQLYNLGAADYIIKPISSSNIEDSVRNQIKLLKSI